MNTKMQEKKNKRDTIRCSYDIMYSSYVAVLLAYSVRVANLLFV